MRVLEDGPDRQSIGAFEITVPPRTVVRRAMRIACTTRHS